MADKKVDLTKFDFHAMRFAHSEDCQRMTDAEVGQYLLLMIQAWLGGKAASLPNDPALLARYARCEKVSDLVMSKWDLRDGRLYNDMLSEEWARTSLRVAESNAKYQATIDSGKKGGESKSEAKAEAARANGMKGGRPKTEAPIGLEPNGETQPTMPLPIHANPMHTMPSQPTIALHCAQAPAIVAGLPTNDINNGREAMAMTGAKARQRREGIFSDDDLESDDIGPVDFGEPDRKTPGSKLAQLFYNNLPEENQDAAPAPWLKLWTEDFAELLKTTPYDNIEMVIKSLPQSKSRQYIVRATTFCEKFERLLAEAKKINKVKEVKEKKFKVAE